MSQPELRVVLAIVLMLFGGCYLAVLCLDMAVERKARRDRLRRALLSEPVIYQPRNKGRMAA